MKKVKNIPVVSNKFEPKIASKITEPTKVVPTQAVTNITKPTNAFTQALAREIVKNLTTLGELTARPFRRKPPDSKTKVFDVGDNPIFVDTSILIDGRIVPIVNSGFMAGTLLIPQFVLEEVQHIADSSDLIRRTKGRRGLDVVSKLKSQKANDQIKTKVINEEVLDVKEVDHKLVSLVKKYRSVPGARGVKLLTVDFNLAQLARAQGVKVLNVNDLAQAIKIALVPGEEFVIRISHAGKEREQGVGYLEDGTMVVVDNAKDKVGFDIKVTVTKIHQTPAGQLFFARLS
jgi:uncharacterized protein YacL